MIILLGASMAIFAYMTGVCVGAVAVRDERGELVLPAGWWMLPGGIMGGLLVATTLV